MHGISKQILYFYGFEFVDIVVGILFENVTAGKGHCTESVEDGRLETLDKNIQHIQRTHIANTLPATCT